MTLYREIEESKKVYPAQQAIKSFQNVTEIVTDLSEVRIYRTSDGKWLYCGNCGNAIPCVTATSDYQQIEGYAAALTNEEMGGAAYDSYFALLLNAGSAMKESFPSTQLVLSLTVLRWLSPDLPGWESLPEHLRG